MRIIAGIARGRRLKNPDRRRGRELIRPTADRAREAIFNVLSPNLAGGLVLDLFAGTGALGLEALSRGAKRAVFVDCNREALSLVQQNIDLCGFTEQAEVVSRDLGRGLASCREMEGVDDFTLVFLDPPYGSDLSRGVMEELGVGEILAEQALVVLEDESSARWPDVFGCLGLIDQRQYGETGFWIYRVRT